MKSLKLDKIIEYGVYLFVFLLPWQTKLILRPGELGRGPWEYGTISLYGTDILLAGLLILFLIHLLKNKKAVSGVGIKIDSSRYARNDKVLLVIMSGLDLFMFISIFFAPDKALALYRYAIVLLGIGLFWLIAKAEYSKIKLAIAFFSALAIQGILAVWQFLTQSTFASKWLGMALHFSGEPGTSTIETRGADGVAERWLRAYGSLDHPNILGGLLAIGLIILVFYFTNKKEKVLKKEEMSGGNRIKIDSCATAKAEGDTRSRHARNDKIAAIIFYFLLLALFSGLMFAFSRSAFLAFIVGFLVVFSLSLIKMDWLAIKRLAGVMLLLGIIFSAIFINYQNLFITRASGSERLEAKSFSERKMYLDDSLGLIKSKVIFGSGLGNYTKALSDSKPKQPWYYLQPVHNVFLLAWAEIGIFGLLFFLAFLGYLFWQAIRKKNALGLSLLLGLVIIMSLDHYLWSLHFGVLSFWLLAGFIYKENKIV